MSLDDLKNHKDAILLAEIGALIHDLGKLSEEFVESHSENSKKRDEHARILEKHKNLKAKLEDRVLADILDDFDLFIKNRQLDALSLDRFISKHHDDVKNSPIYYYRLLSASTRGCDGIDSGIDKGNPVKKQRFHETYMSTTFGYDKEKMAPPNLTQERNDFCKILEDQLQRIIEAKSKGVDILETIIKSRKGILEAVEKHFSKALGETRRAANDVTLWDHSYSVASLYKSALAGIVLEHKNSQTHTLPEPKDLKWRILTISVNGADFWMKSEKIGDIVARKNLIEDSFDEIKKLLEEEIPLGNEVYRDENSIAFLVFERFCKKLRISQNKTIEERISDIFKEKTDCELRPHIQPSKPSRGAVTLGDLLKEIKKLNKPFEEDIGKHWTEVKPRSNNAGEIEICRVCGLRAVGVPQDEESKKAEKRHICTVCLGRRKNRSRIWMKQSRKQKDTIWIDEVSDPNNRVTLIVGKFDLESWIDSTYLNTMFTKTLSDLHNSNAKGVAGLTGYPDLIKAASQSFTQERIRVGQITIDRKDFLESIGKDPNDKRPVDEYFNALILDRERERLEEELGNPDNWDTETKASLLISFLFRKNPSFARTRRIWETTLKFWEDVDEKIKNTLSEDPRYKITFKESMDFSISHTYYLRVTGCLVPTVASGKNEMLIVEKKDKLPELLNKYIRKEQLDEKIEILESDKKTSIGEGKVEKIEKDSVYIPYINILKEPSVFISLVPAEKALKVARLIKEKYETEFSKVKNRLPMNLCLLFMNKKMPLYIALNSARRFLEFKNRSECREVLGACDTLGRGSIEKRKLILKKEDVVETEMDLLLGNGEVDYYHPYFIIERGSCTDKRNTYFETYWKKKLIHVIDLVKGDIVEYVPSFFDFVFLDSNTRRFDISTENRKRPHPIFTSGPRPYYLEDIDKFHEVWEILEKKCDNTQLNNFDSLLISKIEGWNIRDLKKLRENEEFKKLVEASIKNILRIDREDRDFKIILDSVLSGMFFDVKELYHTILKKKLGGEENE